MVKQCLGCMEEYSLEFSVCPHCGYIEGTAVEEAVHMEPGTSLADRYIIGKVLGYGGFGVTYIAWDKLLEQKVAIKEYLPSEFSTRMPGDPTVTIFSGDRSEQFTEGLDKFVEEAKRLSKFQNEAGIVKVFDSFKSNNTAYIVMEYLDGETLTSYMEREGVISEDKAVEMLAPLMSSLQAVHEAGILHRDIAPDNIFLTKSGEVKLIDFGASRYATTSHSRSLTVIIKPGYSPEEQYRSRGDQGPHTDVYALAAVMYKMITGITPPDALERRALIETKKKELLVDIHKTNKTISPNIENAILNAMNVQVEDRTHSVLSFISELNSNTPVKRRYGKIKKIDVYAWPLWIKIVIPAVVASFLVTAILLTTGIIKLPTVFSGDVVVPEGMVIVPDIEGMDKEEALNAITEAGLTPSPDGNAESAYVDAGKIVLQEPQSGSYLEKGGTVILTVSSGDGVKGPVNGISTVPYVVWDTKENAIAKMQKAGLNPKIEMIFSDSVAAGNIISQGTDTGAIVASGTDIKLVMSIGKNQYLSYKTTSDGIEITKCKENASGKIYIPSVIDDKSVTKIGKEAFYMCMKITEVVLPESISEIGNSAFFRCEKLNKINIPSSVKKIGNNTFISCAFTELIFTDGLEIIGDSAFSDCFKVTKIVLPKTIKRLEHDSLSYCNKVTEVLIPDGIEYINERALPVYSWGDTTHTSLKTVYFESEETKNKFAKIFSPANLVVIDKEN